MSRYFSGKGDAGETDLFDGRKVPKDSPILEIIGTFDQLNAQIGLAISLTNHAEIRETLWSIQITLSKIMSLLAGARESGYEGLDIDNEITGLEELIIDYGRKLDPPDDFTFTGETSSSAALNICRTETRKTERRALTYLHEHSNFDQRIIAYLNRLSSMFYVLSIFIDQAKTKNQR
jgi:cob(I)alamin adenosyltransferase